MSTLNVTNLDRAKAMLVVTQPFFASLLLQMPMSEDKTIKTMATDGESIRYSPDFVKAHAVSELTFVLAHEVMHAALEHCLTRGARNHNRWNIATDYVINDILVAESVGTMPKIGLHDPAIVKEGNGTASGVYALLPEETEDKNAGDRGGAMDELMDAAPDGDEATTSQKSAEMKVKVIQAANAAKMQGKLSAGLQRLVKEMTKPRVDWKAVLRRFLTERCKTDWTYAKPKRRFLAEDIYMPGLTGERLGCIAVAVDCSGSIDDTILAAFGAEINAIKEDTGLESLHVIYFDSEVLKREQYGPDDTVKLSPVGGGGTDFAPIFADIEEQGLEVAACVVLTDLYGPFGQAPAYPVLWACTSDQVAPFGETVEVKLED